MGPRTSYRSSPNRIRGPGWLALHEVQQRPDALAPYLSATGHGRRLPPKRQLLGTPFVQVNAQYVHNVVALALLERPVARLVPARTSVLIARPGNSVDHRAGNTLALALGDPVPVSASTTDRALAAREAIVEHAAVVIEAVCSLTRISPARRAVARRRDGHGAPARARPCPGRGANGGAPRRPDPRPRQPLAVAPPRRFTVTVDGVDHGMVVPCRLLPQLPGHTYCTAYCPLADPAELTSAAIETLRSEPPPAPDRRDR